MMSLVLFLVLLMLSAGGVPSAAPDTAAGAPPHAVAYVNGTPIMSDRLDMTVNALIPQESFHRSVSPEKVAELRRTALQSLVDEELQYQDADERGITASVDEVDAALAEVAARYASPQAFAAARRRANVTLEEVRHEIRRTVMIRKAWEEAVTSRCQVDRGEAASFFEANRERFVVPEELRIQAITIGVDPSSPPAAWASAKARALDVRRRVLAGAPFEEMARQYSTDPTRESGGDMGFFHRGSLVDDFERATSGLGPGELSDVVQTIYGYHLVRIMEVRPSRQKTFDDVSGELIRDLTAKRCAERKDAWLARLRAGAAVGLVDDAGVEPTQEPLPPGGMP
jgi:parvulin-like peptidyl-prolyl isomerase